MAKEILSQEKITEILESLYSKTIEGIPSVKLKPCIDVANEYLNKYAGPFTAADKCADSQIRKCATSGFVTSLGGILTLPVALPANLTSVWFIQLRMIAIIAAIGGYDVKSDEVETLCFSCLVGTSVTRLAQKAGVTIATKSTKAAIQKIPGSLLTKINQAVGFRLVTKFGSKGVINLHKAIPFVGGVVGGGIDYGVSKVIANRAIRMFIFDIIG